MKSIYPIFFILITIISCQQSDESISIPGLIEPVEVIRDQWGMNHIYAKNQKDLFYSQGYLAAKDRLFQFEIWRRQATGTVAELLGSRELARDHGTRLFKFRGDMQQEMKHYHPDGVEIISSYVAGVNAYIEEIMKTPEQLPLAFKMLGTYPQKWTPEVVISRHQGLLGNIDEELALGRAVAKIGEKKVKEIAWFHPKEPKISLDSKINGLLLDKDILGLYNAYRRSIKFVPEDLILKEYTADESIAILNSIKESDEIDWTAIGSNNWVLSGEKTASGTTIMANDPHRTIAVPSLRYMAHLVAPGWNVIGGGEPEIPGISIGHNEFGAWGLTIFRTDGEDLMVYELNPDNLNQYKYQDEWVDMEVLQEAIKVKDAEDVLVELKYTRHGPVSFIDSANAVGYAVRCAWLEPGGSPYLASLRMDQAKTWEEFRDACNYSHIPGENMIWADKNGNIGWQAVGIAPIRRNWSGMVPVPGDGSYEWDGYLPIIEKPSIYNPPAGFFATANQNVTPDTYNQWDAITYSWSDPYRGDRVNEVLSENRKFTMEEMKSLQTDYLSLPARTLVPFLKNLNFVEVKYNEPKSLLSNWDFILTPNSIPAGIYVAWETAIRFEAKNRFVPDEASVFISPQLKRIVDWIENPNPSFGSETSRNEFLKTTFKNAIDGLEKKLGPGTGNWKYGQENYKYITINHPLAYAVNDSLKKVYNVGPYPRGGNGYTPGSTSNNLNQSSGASFRMIVDTGNWDKAIGTNTPGQSGDPTSRFYSNTFETWASDNYFPMFYSKAKVIESAAEKFILLPGGNQ